MTEPQPNPCRVVVSRESLKVHPPCCGRPVVLGRDGIDITLAEGVAAAASPSCQLWWQAKLRVSCEGLSARWRRTDQPGPGRHGRDPTARLRPASAATPLVAEALALCEQGGLDTAVMLLQDALNCLGEDLAGAWGV